MFRLEYETHKEYIEALMKEFGYNQQEAINILDGKNSDDSLFEELPF